VPHTKPFVFIPTAAEVRKLTTLFRRIQALSNARDGKELTWEEYWSRDRELRTMIQAIAGAVGLRTIGELPLTLREADWTEESPRKPVVVLEYAVHGWRGELVWVGDGVELKKDGAVGERMGSMRLDQYPLFRRHLDGSWLPLVPKC
jgi:hypothetical protein